MITTIDHAGRLVIPKKLRDSLHLTPGTPIELESDGEGLRLRVPGTGPALAEKKGFLVHTGARTVDVDITALISRQRSERDRQVSGLRE